MKLIRNLIIIGVLIVVLGAGYYFATKYEPPTEHTDIPQEKTITLFDVNADRVIKIVVKITADSFTLVKDGNGWKVEGKDYIELTGAVETYIYNFAKITASEIIDEKPQDKAIYGLTEPQAEIAVSAEGVEKSFKIGSLDPTGNYYYVAEDGKNTVYTVVKANADAYFKRLNSLRSMTVTNIDTEDVRGIEIKSGSTALNVVRSDGGWDVKNPQAAAAQNKKFNEKLLTPLCKITANDIVEDNPADLSKYGFDKEVTVTVENGTLTLYIGSANGAYYIYPKGSVSVYSVGYDSIAFAYLTAQDIM